MAIDFDKIKADIDEHKYSLIGSGSGRNVYDLDNGYVVKSAKNRRGLAQNKAEHEIATNNKSHYFAKIKGVSEDYRFLIMEKADRIKSFSEVWNYYKVRNIRELFQLEDFRDVIIKSGLLTVDLERRTSWGMIKGKPVIIDFGFTREVRRYYNIFNF